jgi:hypothetical protein
MNRQDNSSIFWWPIIVFGLLTALVVIATHRYLPSQPSPLASRFTHSLHAPGFALIAAAAWWLFRWQRPGLNNYGRAILLSVVAAVLGETAQVIGPRNAQLSDLGIDVIGIFGALGTIAIIDQLVRPSSRRRWLLVLAPAVVAALFVTFRDSVSLGATLVGRTKTFPVLLSFEHGWESNLYTASQGGPASIIPNPDGWPTDGGEALLQVEAAGRWNVVLRLYPYPDWNGHETLTFVAAAVDGKRHALTLSVSDTPTRLGQPFKRHFSNTTVDPEPRRISIPLQELGIQDGNRPLDRHHVYDIILTTDYQGQATTLLLDDFRLE